MKNLLRLNVKKSLVSLFLMATATLTFAQTPITIENGDFSLPGTGRLKDWADVPGWSSDNTTVDSGVEESGWYMPADNNDYAGVLYTGDGSTYNLTDYTIEEGYDFTVTMEGIVAWNGPTIVVSLYYDNGDGTRNVIKQQSFTVVSDAFTNIELTATATAESIGNNLGIEVYNESADGGDGWTAFDEVSLTKTATTPTAIDPSKSDSEISVYPTSSTSSFNVVAPIGSSIKVFSISGILVSQTTAETNTTKISVNESGVYIINVGSESFKVLKQ